MNNVKIRLAIMASGNGSNAQALIAYFKDHPVIQIALLLTNNPKAFVIERAVESGIPMMVIGKQIYGNGERFNEILNRFGIDYLILAGYLKAIPKETVSIYPNKIINIHPALLPKYGGKGMYGDHVHQAVLNAGETESGITIHYVTENYDEGPIIFQERVDIAPDWKLDDLKTAIHHLEHHHFASVIEEEILRFRA